GKTPTDSQYLTAPVTFHLDHDANVMLVEVGTSRAVLKQGEWSDWMEVRYDALPAGLAGMTGVVGFYARGLGPALPRCASPVNISPASPAQEISTPSKFAPELAGLLGPFYTEGMPEDVNALKDKTFTDDDYESQVALVQRDERAMLDLALARFARGHMTFMYLSDIDLQCHMLWRHKDPKYPDAPPHPAREDAVAAAHAGDIENYYRHVDDLLGEV